MQTILRYLSKEKLEWLLSDKGIYIGAAFSQSDKSEGVYDHTLMSKALKENTPCQNNVLLEEIDNLSFDLMHLGRQSSFLCSWYLSDNETHDMWDEYAKGGVVIISNVMSLIIGTPEPLKQASSFYNVTYCDDKKINATHEPLKYKNKKFKYENEFRLVVDLQKYSILTGYEKKKFGEVFMGDVPSYQSKEITCCMSDIGLSQAYEVIHKKHPGYVIKFDLNEIIHEIRLSPECSDIDEINIKSLCNEYGLKCPVRYSTLKGV